MILPRFFPAATTAVALAERAEPLARRHSAAQCAPARGLAKWAPLWCHSTVPRAAPAARVHRREVPRRRRHYLLRSSLVAATATVSLDATLRRKQDEEERNV